MSDDYSLIRKAPDLSSGLYVVATPIGNLRDITLRALDVLASVDLILAEDTRVTRRLLDAYGIKTPVKPYHDHNAAKARPGILRDLTAGGKIALVSDAGTPLVSDPGYKLVRECAEQGITAIAVPGASAVLAALAVAGLPTDAFMFAGFAPPKSPARKRFLEGLKTIPATLVFYEGPSRLADCLADMAETFGNREAVLARELTKKFEEVIRLPLSDLAEKIAEEGPPRGELVILVGPPSGEEITLKGEALDEAIRTLLPDMSVKEAAAQLAETYGLKKRDVYNRALELKD